MSPRHHDIMVDIVAKQLNLVVQKYRKLYHFNGKISILCHSLGSVISWDILSHQKKVQRIVADIDNGFIAKLNAYLTTPETNYQYPALSFEVENCFMIGSPVAVFLMMRNQNYNLSNSIRLPGVCRFFNIFHPYDPVAYRLEPLLDRKIARMEPEIIPHWKFGLRVQYQTKYFLQKLMNETERAKENAVKAVEERIRGIGLLDDSLDDDTDVDDSDASESQEDYEPSVSVTDSFDRTRLDFMLQERELETANEYIAALAAHSSYWESKDLALFIAKQIWPDREGN
jgi:DDHD domain.